MADLVEKSALEVKMDNVKALRQWYSDVKSRPVSKDQGYKYMVFILINIISFLS